ncbi:ribonuclease H-like domain-containing protein [Tanacetum coccineum]
MDDFYREKCIKREYSVARTPQQNRVAERINRTLIEAARTMLADSILPTTFWAEAIIAKIECFEAFETLKMKVNPGSNISSPRWGLALSKSCVMQVIWAGGAVL